MLAHNPLRWTVRLGRLRPDELVVTRTIRRQLIDLPGRLVNAVPAEQAGGGDISIISDYACQRLLTGIVVVSTRLQP